MRETILLLIESIDGKTADVLRNEPLWYDLGNLFMASCHLAIAKGADRAEQEELIELSQVLTNI